LVEPDTGNADEKEEDTEGEAYCASQMQAQRGRGKQTCTADERTQYLHEFVPNGKHGGD
jgi:hypothetical protein